VGSHGAANRHSHRPCKHSNRCRSDPHALATTLSSARVEPIRLPRALDILWASRLRLPIFPPMVRAAEQPAAAERPAPLTPRFDSLPRLLSSLQPRTGGGRLRLGPPDGLHMAARLASRNTPRAKPFSI